MADLITKDLLLNILETNNIEEFRRFTRGPLGASSCLINLARVFPEHRNQLFAMATQNADEFLRFTTGPLGASSYLDDLVRVFPEHRNQLFAMAIQNADEFLRFTTGPLGASSCLINLARVFPEHRNQLFAMATQNADEFLRFTTGPLAPSSTNFAEAFPEYANEINKPTVDEGWQAIQERKNRELYLISKAEIIEKSRIISQGTRTAFNSGSPCFFRKIEAKEIQAHIAGYTGIYGAHTALGLKSPDNIAYKHLNKPT